VLGQRGPAVAGNRCRVMEFVDRAAQCALPPRPHRMPGIAGNGRFELFGSQPDKRRVVGMTLRQPEERQRLVRHTGRHPFARLGELTEARIVDTTEDGYRLTPLGEDLLNALHPLENWGLTWEKILNE